MRGLQSVRSALVLLVVIGASVALPIGAVLALSGTVGAQGFGATNLPPVPFFDYAPSPATVGATIGFDAGESYDPDGTIVRYDWDFTDGGGFDATGMTAVWTFSAPGTYPVTLSVEDNQGATATLTRWVTVETVGPGVGLIDARFSYTPDVPRPGEAVVFNAGDSVVDALPATYQWDFNGDGRFDAVGRTVTHRFQQAGPHRVTLQVTDRLGRLARLTRVVHVGQRRATLIIESDPEDLTVYVDGVERGRTPMTLELDPGHVHVRVRHYWRGEWEANIDLIHTRSLRLFVELR